MINCITARHIPRGNAAGLLFSSCGTFTQRWSASLLDAACVPRVGQRWLVLLNSALLIPHLPALVRGYQLPESRVKSSLT